jgi:hypothetical protein
MVSPIGAAHLRKHYNTVWMAYPPAGGYLCGLPYSEAITPHILVQVYGVNNKGWVDITEENWQRSDKTCRLSTLQVQEAHRTGGSEPRAGACLLLCGNAHN